MAARTGLAAALTREHTMTQHRRLLPWIMVIVTIKVKIIVRPR
ncbi:MAG: hypothetical protein M0Z28_24510 [Rhodospirillales bacterium]|nr:hypothetical protein [Rhodospirillales bacterium]